MELETGKKVKCLGTDIGKECLDGDFIAFCKESI